MENTERPKAKKRITRRILKIFAYLLLAPLGLVIFLLVSLNLLLQIGFVTDFVLRQALPPVEKLLQADIEVGRLSLRFVPFRLILEDVRFGLPEDPYAQPFARLDRLLVSAKTGPLFEGRVEVEALSVEGVQAYLVITETGLANLPMPPPSPQEEAEKDDKIFQLKLPIAVEILRLAAAAEADFPARLARPTPENDDPRPSSPLHAKIAALKIDGEADLDAGDTQLYLEIADVSLAMGEQRLEIPKIDLKARANLQTWEAEIARLSLASDNLALDVTATAKDLMTEIDLAAKVNIEAGLAAVNQFALTGPQDPRLAGDLALALEAGLHVGEWETTYRAGGEVTIPEGRVNDLSFKDFKLAFHADPQEAEVESFHLQAADGAVDLQAKLGLTEKKPVSAKLQIAHFNVGKALSQFGLKDLPASGIVSGRLDARGDLAPLSVGAEGRIELAQAAYGDVVRIGKVVVDLDADSDGQSSEIRHLSVTANDIAAGGQVMPQATVELRGRASAAVNRIDRLRVATPYSTVEVAGTANLNGPLNLQAAVELNDLSEFKGFVGKEIAGQGKIEAQVRGTTANPDVAGSLRFADLVFDQYRLDAVAAKVAYHNKKAEVEDLLVEAGVVALKVDAGYDMRPREPVITAEVNLPETEIPEILKLLPQAGLPEVKGKTDLHVAVDGSLEHLTGQVDFHAKQLEAFGEKVELVSLDAQLADGAVLLEKLEIVKNRGIRPIYRDGMYRIKSEKEITAADREPARIALSGRVHPFEKTFDLKLRTENLTEQASNAVAEGPMRLFADLALQADLAGTFENPGGSLQLRIDNGRYEQMELGNSVIDLSIQDQQVVVKGELLAGRRAEAAEPKEQPAVQQSAPVTPDQEKSEVFAKSKLGSIKLDAVVALSEGLPLEAAIVFDRFAYSGFLQGSDAVSEKSQGNGKKKDQKKKAEETETGGLIDGALTVTGRLSQPAPGRFDAQGRQVSAPDLTVDLKLDNLMFRQNQLVIRNQDKQGKIVPIEIHYEQDKVTVLSFGLGGKGVQFDLVSQQLRGENYLVLTGDIGLEVGSAFSKALAEAKGKLELRAEIPVAFAMNKVVADVTIPKGSLAIQNVPSVIENLRFDLHFADGQAEIRKLSAAIGGGRLTGGGSYRLPAEKKKTAGGEPVKEPARLDMFIKLSDVKTGFDPYVELALKKIDINVNTREDGKLDVTGEVEIGKAVVSYNYDISNIFKTFQSKKGAVAGAEVYRKKEESIFLNIGIRAERRIQLDNNFAQLEARTDLLLTGTDVEPGMIGSVEILKGQASVLQNKYRLTSGVIQFFDERRIYPTFDINAQTEVNEIKIFINVSGTPDAPKFSLSSDPAHTERDIIVLLSLGISYEEFQAAGSEGSNEEAIAAAAAQQLLGGQIKSYTGLDIGVDNSRGTAQFKATKELLKDLDFSIFRGISDESLAAELEYDFMRYMATYTDWSNFAGQENVPPAGGFGAGIRLKIEFR